MPPPPANWEGPSSPFPACGPPTDLSDLILRLLLLRVVDPTSQQSFSPPKAASPPERVEPSRKTGNPFEEERGGGIFPKPAACLASRGGTTSLCGDRLERLFAPTLCTIARHPSCSTSRPMDGIYVHINEIIDGGEVIVCHIRFLCYLSLIFILHFFLHHFGFPKWKTCIYPLN